MAHGLIKERLIACHDCDLLQSAVAVPPGGSAQCSRCGALLYRNRPDSIRRSLAYTLAAGMAFAMGNCFPIFTLQAAGVTASTTLVEAAVMLWQTGMQPLSLLIIFAAVIAPALRYGIACYALLHVLSGRGLHWSKMPLRFLDAVRPWAMVEVFMLGILVAVVKIAAYASVKPGIGLWSFCAVVILQSLASTAYEAEDVWSRLDAPTREETVNAIPEAEAAP